jgi:crotonobetainyl-CoA:carnitine CoA-transferase CaiB-like acyl-CoA transferase
MAGQALAGVRVLELGTMVAAPYCAKLMADLGADVVKVEAPGTGDPARLRGPFPGGVAHPERSALFLYANTSKRGITLDVTKEEGARLFARLAETADLVIEDHVPGELASLGLDYTRLAEANPRLVMVSITPFGQTGPYAGYRTYHLNQYQAGGFTSGFYEGKDQRAPAQGGGYVAEYDAGVAASVACMAALLSAGLSGRGQHVDISKQEVSMCLERVDIGRAANEGNGQRPAHGGPVGGLLETRDGYLMIVAGSDKHFQGLVEAMGNPAWANEDWCKDEITRSDNSARIQEHIKEWAANQTRHEVYHELQRRGTPAGAVLNASDARNWVQLQERGFFTEVEHPEAGAYAYPGTPCRFSSIDWSMRPAPMLGQHNREVYGDELGLSEADIQRLACEGVI